MRATGATLVCVTAPFFADALSALGAHPRFAVDVHVLFNLGLAIVFLPLVSRLATLVRRYMPTPAQDTDGPRHLDPAALDSPKAALVSASRETMRIGDTVERMLELSLMAFRTDDEKHCRSIRTLDDKVDRLQEAVKLYIAKLGLRGLDEEEQKISSGALSYAINLEHIGDIVEKSLARSAMKKISQQIMFSEEGFAEIERFFMRTIENIHLAQTVFLTRDAKLARKLLENKVEIRHLEDESWQAHLRRFQEGQPESLQSSSLHLDVLRDLKRVNAHIASVAYPILSDLGVLRESRLRSEQTQRPETLSARSA